MSCSEFTRRPEFDFSAPFTVALRQRRNFDLRLLQKVDSPQKGDPGAKELLVDWFQTRPAVLQQRDLPEPDSASSQRPEQRVRTARQHGAVGKHGQHAGRTGLVPGSLEATPTLFVIITEDFIGSFLFANIPILSHPSFPIRYQPISTKFHRYPLHDVVSYQPAGLLAARHH